MKRIFVIVVVSVLQFTVIYAQGPKVPSRLEFAGIQLNISNAARNEIQRDVDALTHSPKYFQIKVDRAVQYFPIIERIFSEEGLPEDFKYLVLQESALIPDAVSSSNAVGFWQFKQASGQEMGLRMDNHVDERMNIVSSSRAAAHYIQRNNYYFNNWVLALQAYQMGAGAAMRSVGDKYNGAKIMDIDKSTYWYVKKFLAHMIAFRDAIQHNGNNYLKEFTGGSGMTLQQIAREYNVDYELLKDYNKWVKKSNIPSDRDYAVIIPGDKVDLLARETKTTPETQESFDDGEAVRFPEFDRVESPDHPFILEVNGILGIIARESDEIETLAQKGELDEKKFRKYNDIPEAHTVTEGQVYYLKSKRNRSRIHFHVLQYNESLWEVSQKYGIKLRSLVRKNRIEDGETLKPGRVLWLRKKRPSSLPVEYRTISEPEAPEPATVRSEENSTSTAQPVAPAPEESRNVTDVNEVADQNSLEKEEETIPALDDTKPETTKVSEPENEINTIPTETKATERQNNTKTVQHEVQAGETLYAISRRYDVKVNDILTWNEMDLNEAISIGQVLTIRIPESAEVSSLEQKFRNETSADDLLDRKPEISKSGSMTARHTVVAGETLFAISRKYRVTVDQLTEWNDLDENGSISEGQILEIRTDGIEEDEVNREGFITYEVKPGDSLYKISREHNVTIEDLLKWNEKENSSLSVGEKILIRK